MSDDPQWRELTAAPKYRRIFITDGRNPVTLPLVTALKRAEAREIVIGVSDSWKPFPQHQALAAVPGVSLVDLDVTSERSVDDVGRDYAAKTEILINTVDHLRPGGVLAPGLLNPAREAMEALYFGQIRLAQAFAPAMAARGADGDVGAAAWVNIFSIFGEAQAPGLIAYAAAQAAAIALSRGVRAELMTGGVRLTNVLCGPTETEWFQSAPQPKVTGKALADAVVSALELGLEEVYVGDVAKDLRDRNLRNSKALERELAANVEGLTR